MSELELELNRERIITQYGYLCARAARRFVRPGLDRADLEQIAAIGLIKACDRYDASLRTPFEAFAWVFVLGELMHYVRDYERLVKPPRRVRQLERRCQAAFDEFVAEQGREPTHDELAARLRITSGQLFDVTRYREGAIPESLDGLPPHQLPRSYALDERDDRIVFEQALESLSEVERTIILAVYAIGYSQLELANRLGYSRRHISRLHRAALKKMQPFCGAQSA